MKKSAALFAQASTRLRNSAAAYERHLSVLAFLAGFAFDLSALPRVDTPFAHLIFGTYLTIVTCALLVRERVRADTRARALLTFTSQFFFGSLLSAIVVYYSRSATLVSWPLFLLLAAMVALNEFVRDEKRKLAAELTLLYFILFMATNFIVPVYLGRTSGAVFLLAGVFSLVCFAFVLLCFAVVAPRALRSSTRGMLIGVAGVYAALHLLYAAAVIPPIPLSLRHADIAHALVRRIDGSYRLEKEPPSWGEYVGRPVRVHLDGRPLYFFSSVFAPTAFATTITHEWARFDERTDEWQVVHRVTFPITGGRDGGYRGYSLSEQVTPGTWRVRVMTKEGVRIGETVFVAEEGTTSFVTHAYDR